MNEEATMNEEPTMNEKATMNEEPIQRKIAKENFGFYGVICFIYAIFYTFCTYKNDAGIAIFLLDAGTIYFYYRILKKLGKQLKKGSLFFITTILLLGVSIVLTDDWFIIFMSKLMIQVLLVIFLLHQFYEDSKWSFIKYLQAFSILLIESIAAVAYPFSDLVYAIKKRRNKDNHKVMYGLVGLLAAIPMVFIIMNLLISADVIFADLFHSVTKQVFAFRELLWIGLIVIWYYVSKYCFFNALIKNNIKEEVNDRRTLEPMIAFTFTGAISVIYLIFCAVQMVGLFGGYLSLPKGYTYAQYAREGFFQLLFVCIINMVIVLVCMAFFRENKLLKSILSVISACTYVMLVSSAYRMILYIKVYQLTYLRVFVLWALVVIAFLMFGTMIYIYKREFPIFRYFMVVITVCYLIFSYSHPDYIVAKYNIEVIQENNLSDSKDRSKINVDLLYITSLSADAAKALQEYDKNNWNVHKYYEDKNDFKMNIRTFNVSRYTASKTADKFLDSFQ